jgi:hypothetical protein
MTILVNNKPRCTSFANYGLGASTGSLSSEQRFEVIESYTPCEEIEVKKGDNVTLDTYYDLNKHQL